ncbi:hypothetical protein [Streptomyces sp. 7N604]|uniref:hypothetical protein n=1 Tax=Streptomyces sp. 7N604 TaxID=3457415 RepID=UPI003FD101F6
MHRLLAAILTCMAAAALAFGAAVGIVAALSATPEQPNVPLVSFPHGTAGSSQQDQRQPDSKQPDSQGPDSQQPEP